MTNSAPLRLHVLPEYIRSTKLPHSSPYIRLIRPLTHPSLAGRVEATFGQRYRGQAVDAVIVDRLWCPEVDMALVERLVAGVRRAGTRLIYALDDNLMDLPELGRPWPTPELAAIMVHLLRTADGVLVTTESLRKRVAEYNARIGVLPNMLDERLLGVGRVESNRVESDRAESDRVESDHVESNHVQSNQDAGSMAHARSLVIGYMGTLTHDDDLQLVIPALRAFCERFKDSPIIIELLGVTGDPATLAQLSGLPVRLLPPPPETDAYPMFMLWFTNHVRWDIAIAPLCDTPFHQAKSDIKFLDYAALGAAGIFSHVPAYAGTVRHGQTGWLAANEAGAWAEALTTLAGDEALRRRLARGAADYLFRERTVARRSGDWVVAIRRLLA